MRMLFKLMPSLSALTGVLSRTIQEVAGLRLDLAFARKELRTMATSLNDVNASLTALTTAISDANTRATEQITDLGPIKTAIDAATASVEAIAPNPPAEAPVVDGPVAEPTPAPVG